jgi:oxygen-independent coproporphyrinogen-3 oxidase
MLETASGAVRFANVDDLASYGLPGSRGERTPVGAREAFDETIFLGLRMNDGVAVQTLREHFAGEWVETYEESARDLVREGLMTEVAGCWRLTGRGRLVSNEVFGHLLEGVTA